MRKIEHQGLDHFVSADWENLYQSLPQDGLKMMSQSRVRLFTRQPLVIETLNAWSRARSLQGCAMLESHGAIRDNKWVILEENVHFPVQRWIDENDGKYAALILFICNPRNDEVTAAESAVLHANRDFSLYSSDTYSTPLARLYIPGEEYLEEDPGRLISLVNRLRVTENPHSANLCLPKWVQ